MTIAVMFLPTTFGGQTFETPATAIDLSNLNFSALNRLNS
jgi:hypothetical protein